VTPQVAILIGTRQRCDYLQRCLESLQTLPSGFAQIIVVDAASTDGTREFLSSRNDVISILEDAPSGQAAGLNKAAEKVIAPLICWLSDDNRVLPGAIEEAVELLDEDQRIGLVGLRVKDTRGPYASHPFIGGVSDAGVITCNQGILRTDLFRKIGGFDLQLRDYLIDSDITIKVLLAGAQVVHLRRVAVLHDRERGDQSWMSLENRKAQTRKNRALFAAKYSAYVEQACARMLQSKDKIKRQLWTALVQRELKCRVQHADCKTSEFYRTHALYAKASFVALTDICPPGERWSLRQILSPALEFKSQEKTLSVECARVYSALSFELIGVFETLGYLHSRWGALSSALARLAFIKFVAKLSTNRDRFYHFILWVADIPAEQAKYVLDVILPSFQKVDASSHDRVKKRLSAILSPEPSATRNASLS
jgi:GT2 family glycosyltransferase